MGVRVPSLPQMDKNTTKNWRKRTKERMVTSMGGKCQSCGYHKNSAAFDFHHIIPSTKLFGLSGAKSNHIGWERIVIELRKCLILCANCHRELHSGELELDYLTSLFEEKYVDYKELYREEEKRICSVCKEFKWFLGKTCSVKCSHINQQKADWDNIDLLSMKKEGMSYAAIGKQFGCSGNTIKHHIKKINNFSVS